LSYHNSSQARDGKNAVRFLLKIAPHGGFIRIYRLLMDLRIHSLSRKRGISVSSWKQQRLRLQMRLQLPEQLPRQR